MRINILTHALELPAKKYIEIPQETSGKTTALLKGWLSDRWGRKGEIRPKLQVSLFLLTVRRSCILHVLFRHFILRS